MIKDIDQRIGRAIGRIRQAFRVLLTGVDTSRPIILVQADGLAGEQLQAAEYFQHYGYTSNPPAGSQGVVLPIGGKTAHGIMIATEHGSYRLKKPPVWRGRTLLRRRRPCVSEAWPCGRSEYSAPGY
ncbi:phage baseplate assembly protein [Leeia sp. TBRC 13508]|uniref:Phage baseplate assembly protein n=1 Tax=Leeia speluncae TaxID=2884804 RepID=A0ABS8D298_9NEIS|nr:phage baseplate assembly protein [Leeia speluncae]MCB6182307.1 phage baseplate assembly protein [Leeia speluncae]